MPPPPVLTTPDSVRQSLGRAKRQLELVINLPLRLLWQSATPDDRTVIGEDLDEAEKIIGDIRRSLGI